ncbi:MAG: energy transducer TonB [Lysobacteraceae bacterium]|nr:MAG: energy transducer TonB [Xanthomonadaceae bacterium]
MSTPNQNTPNQNQPGYNQVDPDAPVVAPPRRSSAMLWALLLVALVALALWWYGKRPAAEPLPPATPVEQPVAEGDAATPAATRTPDAAKPVAKPKPRPVAAVANRDPEPLPGNQSPKYPPQALRSGVEGSVNVRIEVDANGNPTDVRVVQRSGERSRDLDRAVIDAARKWRFQPAMQDGKAVAGAVVLPVEFKTD